MRQMDLYSFRCGVMECFCEMVHAGVKDLALSHPFSSPEERREYLEFAADVSGRYGLSFFLEDDPLITDLFPVTMNRNKCNIIFYRDDAVRDAYLQLKEKKQTLKAGGLYCGHFRIELARRYGRLLSYPESRIEALIEKNTEREP